MTARRRRGLLFLAVALASGGLAASRVHEREQSAARALGPSVEVLVAASDLRAGARVTRAALAMRRMPARFAPPGALGSPAGVVGARVAAAIPAGGYVTAAAFEDARKPGGGNALRRGERAVTVEVAGGGAIAELAPGARVDVLVSTETGAGGGRTTMALAGVELLRLGEGGASDPSAGPTALATLRVTVRQSVYITAADNFAREIRLLARPLHDRSRAGGVATQADL